MKNGYNELIYEPQFNEAKRVHTTSGAFWIVGIDERYGLLHHTGSPIFPIEYENIEHLRDSFFILTTDGVCQVFDLSGKTYSEKYQSINLMGHEHGFPSNRLYYRNFPIQTYYSYSLNGKIGVLNQLFEPLTEPVYKSISPTAFSTSIEENSFQKLLLDTAFIVMNDQFLKGYLHLDGSEWIPCKYESITPINSYDLDSTKTNYFLVHDSLGYLGLCDSNGTELIPTLFDELIPNSKEVIYGGYQNFESFIGVNEQGATIFSTSGKQLDPFESAISFGQYSIIKENKTWSVLDKDLNYVVSELEGLPSIQQREFQGFYGDPYYTEHRKRYTSDSYDLDPDFHVVFQCEPHEFKKIKRSDPRFKRQKYTLSEYGNRGLVDLKSGKTIPMKYQEFTIRQDSLDTYYWAFYGYSSETGNQKVDIYNGDLTLIRTLELNCSQPHYLRNRKYLGQNSRLYFAHKDGKLGAFDCTGETVIPFEFDDHYPRMIPTSRYEYDRIKSYVMQKGERDDNDEPYSDLRFGLYSALGEEIYKPEYTSITNYGSQDWILNKNGKYTIIEQDYTVRMSNCSYVLSERLHNYEKFRLPKKYSQHLVVHYAIHNDTLYALFPDTIVLMNADNYAFGDPINLFLSRILINKNGRVISTTEVNIYQFKNKNGYSFVLDSTLIILDEFGDMLESVPNILHNWPNYKDELHVSFHDNRSALYDMKKLKWILRPDYPCRIESMTSLDAIGQAYFWIGKIDSLQTINNWQLVDSSGASLLDYTLDYPVGNFEKVVRKNAKYGLLDADLNVLIPFEYDFIQLYEDVYVFVKDSLWGFYSHNELIEPRFNSVSTKTIKNQHFVFVNEKVGVMNAKNEYSIPLQHLDSLISNYDLQKELGIEERENVRMGIGAIEIKDSLNDDYRIISNRNILNYFTVFSSKNQIMENTSYASGGDLRYSSVSYSNFYNSAGKNIRTYIQHAKNGYYSETVSTMEFVRKEWNQTYRQNDLMLKKNYRIENGIAQLVSLDDLFLDEVNLDETLRRIITEILTKEQTFGLACINSQALFNEMKRNFYILEKGIAFYYRNQEEEEESILVPAEKLMPYLKDKKMFD